MSGASERANGRASGPVLTSLFLFVSDHSAVGEDEGVKQEGEVVVEGEGIKLKDDSSRHAQSCLCPPCRFPYSLSLTWRQEWDGVFECEFIEGGDTL